MNIILGILGIGIVTAAGVIIAGLYAVFQMSAYLKYE